MSSPRLVVAAASSGMGKTTVTLGIAAALTRMGRRVQSFKVGPDYIDPAFHSAATGLPCRNLDSWMTGSTGVLESFRRGRGSDISIVEGVMGLFDGRRGSILEGSTAEVALLLKAPVILVLDVAKMSGSAAAVAYGFARLRPELRIAGVILNNVGSARHRAFVSEAISSETSLPLLGCLPRSADVEMPHRHLGLLPAAEQPDIAARIEAAAELVSTHVDLDAIEEIAASAPKLTFPEAALPTGEAAAGESPGVGRPVRIGVARDEAFSFYYHENLERLEEAGAELVPFSPLRDDSLPGDLEGLYIGGGFPEVFAAELQDNTAMRHQIADAVSSGLTSYAECGGLVYFCSSFLDADGGRFEMAGVIDEEARMGAARRALGYREAVALTDLPIASKGIALRGHEFHWSDVSRSSTSGGYAYHLPEESRDEGFTGKDMVASYVHLHFGSQPAVAEAFVRRCAEARS